MTLSNADMLAMARKLPIPTPWSRDVFVNNLAELRGRPITLVPSRTAVLAGSPCGLWLKRADDDVIVYHAGTSDYHSDQIVCHEVGHMWLGHCRSAQVGEGKDRERRLCRDILPDIDPDAVLAVLGRSDYATSQERDAELFASMVMIAAAEAGEQTSMFRSVFFRRD